MTAAAGGEDEGEDEERLEPQNRTYHVVLRGASVSAGDEMVGKHGRGPLHQEQVGWVGSSMCGVSIGGRIGSTSTCALNR